MEEERLSSQGSILLRVVLIGVDVAIKRQMSKTLMEAWM